MKYSRLFGKTIKEVPTGATIISHQLLYRGGFIRESVAGRYFILPLGQRVENKIRQIIREEMDKAGGQEMVSPTLHPLELWQETNRTNTAGFELMRVKDRRGAEFALGGTAEEMFVDVVRKFNLSYRDLPFNIYQFSNKFRDEMRASGGLLRVREFVMKDAYSFDVNAEEFAKQYDLMAQTYTRIFEKVGLKTYKVLSDNGYIGGEYCHEYVFESPVGESRFFVSEDGKYVAHEDVATFMRTDINSSDNEEPFKIIDQPEWVQTMADLEKHYHLPKSRFLKNVVYRNRTTKEVIIAVIRGDLKVNKTKLEHVLGAVGQLEDATEEDLKSLGTKSGYVHCWGHKGARYVGDTSLTTVKNFIGGQKEEKTDSFNVNYGRDFTCEILADIGLVEDGYLTDDGKQRLISKIGIEVGNIFQLGHHYTNLMKGATFIDKDGQEKPYYMGCYGIGLGRILASVVENYHDDKGIMWPEAVAPFKYHLVGLNGKGEELYQKMVAAGIEVLYDDRDVSAGAKFADADLIGCPIRLVVSDKTGDKIEVKKRTEKESKIISQEDLLRE